MQGGGSALFATTAESVTALWFLGSLQCFSIPARRGFARRREPAGLPTVLIAEAA